MTVNIFFDDVIKDYEIKEYENKNDNIFEAMNFFMRNQYDIMSFDSSLILNPGDTILLCKDYISDIKSNVPIYYIVNNKEFIIDHKTRLFSSLSHLNPIFLKNKKNENQSIYFKRFFIKQTILDKLLYYNIHDGIHNYYYGEIHNR